MTREEKGTLIMEEKKNTNRLRYGTKEEWIKWYEEKSGDTFVMKANAALYFQAKRGIMVCRLTGDSQESMLVIDYVIGDGKFWYDFAEIIATMWNCRCIGTICTRHIESYIRFWDGRIVKKWVQEGQKRFLAKDRRGRYGTLTYRGKDDITGKDTYLAILYLNPGDKPNL